tara:strand:+ start:11094 stop:11456 length:363 start_codon:yes stop_codon:yes gene_type:complete
MSKVSLDVAQRLDITCRKGDTFNLVINVSDSSGNAVDLSTYTFKMEIRDTDVSATSRVANTDITKSGTAGGVLTITIPAATMEKDAGLYVYDLETTKGGVVQTWLTGVLTIVEDVTDGSS